MTLSSSWPGTAVPASALETLVLPGRVPGYEPAMLDELTAAGEVAWSGAGGLPGNDGWIVLAPAGAAPLLFPAPGEITMTPLHEAILSALDGGGALFFRALADRAADLAGQADPDRAHPRSGSRPANGRTRPAAPDARSTAPGRQWRTVLVNGSDRSTAPGRPAGRAPHGGPGGSVRVITRSRPRSGTWSGLAG